MKFVFTNHAKYRVYERKIPLRKIKEVVINPDRQRVDEDDMIVVRKKFRIKVLEVVYKIVKNKFVIITAYYEN